MCNTGIVVKVLMLACPFLQRGSIASDTSVIRVVTVDFITGLQYLVRGILITAVCSFVRSLLL